VTEVELKCADCLPAMCDISPDTVDVVVTSPPYNLGVEYHKYSDRRSKDDYLEWTKKWFSQVNRILAKDGSFFLNIGACPRYPLLQFDVITLAAQYFQVQNVFHWIKAISVNTKDGKISSFGHFKPINSRRYVNDCHEFVIHLTKTGTVLINRLALGVPYVDQSNIKRWAHTGGEDRRCRGNAWYIPYDTIVSRSKQRPHPATFPPRLAENCIRLHGLNYCGGYTVLDPFVGIGSAALGAISVGVKKFIGIDVDEVYIEEAQRRVAVAQQL
jgi:site-specific DNA-methyltransferase (adenine-specific)